MIRNDCQTHQSEKLSICLSIFVQIYTFVIYLHAFHSGLGLWLVLVLSFMKCMFINV